jgi:hypothetical protein
MVAGLRRNGECATSNGSHHLKAEDGASSSDTVREIKYQILQCVIDGTPGGPDFLLERLCEVHGLPSSLVASERI